MKVEHKGNICIIKDDKNDVTAFLMKLTHEHKTFEKNHVIVDLSHHESLGVKHVNAFLPLSQAHKKGKKSFVVIADTDFNKASAKLSVVPTLQEAFDTIEMDEIERDLGF